MVLDTGNKIISSNCPNDKHIICNVNNDIPVKIHIHPYVLVNRSVLCNCSIEVENNFLLESIAACHDSNSKLIMYLTVNTSFVTYLDGPDNLTDSLKFPILMNRTTYEQTLPIFMNLSKFDSELLTAPRMLKDGVHQYCHKKESFYLQERHTNMESELPNKNFFFNNYTIDIFMFVTAIILLLVTFIFMYILCKHMKLKTLVTSLALQQIKEVGVVAKQEGINLAWNIECTCKIQWYTILMLSLSFLGLVLLVILKSQKLKLFRGPLFSNAIKIMLYVPMELCRTADYIHLFKIMGTLTPGNVKLK